MKKKLIINADDFGMSPLWNKGIVELAEKKVVTSISVMIKRRWVKHADLDQLRNISLGLHLELDDACRSADIENQIRLFKKNFNRLPSHIDGHRHCHLRKNCLSKVIALAKKYRLPVRSIFTEKREKMKKENIKTPDAFIDWHPNKKMGLFAELAKLNFSITEMVCHPGYHDKACRYPYNASREKELKILKGKAFKQAIKRFEIVNYRDL